MSAATGPVTCVLILVGAGLYFSPEQVAGRIRTGVSDALRPGQLAARRCVDLIGKETSRLATQSERSSQRKLEQLQAKLQNEQSRSAALVLQLARLSDRQAYQDSLPPALRSLPPLATESLVDATVLGQTVAEDWRKGRILNQGQAAGVRESELVVKSSRSLIDSGRDAGLSAEDTMLMGRCVIGKIEKVGRWSSTFLLLTDAGYRGRAQLVHQTDSGFVYGSKGILEGLGTSHCRLKGIPATDSVTVGDAVYTATGHGPQATPLYYGRVVEATLGQSDREWQVLVEPVPIPNDLSTVQILRISVNSDRLSAGL